jgi:hypothetical protein
MEIILTANSSLLQSRHEPVRSSVASPNGVTFGDATYAYPYSALFATPAILQADHEKRMILMWSAFANRALAMPIGQELRSRDLEVVSTPANALLLYNSRRGEFINGLTGQTPQHERPKGFAAALPLRTAKMPWGDWRSLHPESRGQR